MKPSFTTLMMMIAVAITFLLCTASTVLGVGDSNEGIGTANESPEVSIQHSVRDK